MHNTIFGYCDYLSQRYTFEANAHEQSIPSVIKRTTIHKAKLSRPRTVINAKQECGYYNIEALHGIYSLHAFVTGLTLHEDGLVSFTKIQVHTKEFDYDRAINMVPANSKDKLLEFLKREYKGEFEVNFESI